MKRYPLARTIIAAILICASTSSSKAQQTAPVHAYFRSLPLQGGGDVPAAASAVAAASVTALPLWSYSATASRDRKSYQGMMVGRSPFFHGARTTSINTIVVPVKVTVKDASNDTMVFDPTQSDPACLPNGTVTATGLVQQSPIFKPSNFTMNGVDEEDTQYVDAFQRANFFDAVNPTGNSYHALLNLTKTVPVVSVTMNSPDGAIADGLCGKVGVIDLNVFNPMVKSTILPQLASQGVGPATLPVLVFYNVVLTEGPPDQVNPFGTPGCCVLGFHSGTGSLQSPQLYSVANYDTSGVFTNDGSPLDTATLSHEIGELFDDPLVNNATPAWGNIGQVTGCQQNLEVGDPLSGTFVPLVTMPNGVTYHLQELAFYSWFFGAPSIGAGGVFSDNGTPPFTGDAGPICH